MKKLLVILLVAVMTLGLLSGCGGDASTDGGDNGGNGGTGGEIAILVPSADHGWTGAVLKYAQEKADEINAGGSYTATVYAATDPKNQQEQIDDLLAAATPPAGIVILPYDNTMESSMANVAAAGIPFVMFDRIIDNTVVQEAVLANVKGDNEGIGAATAQRFVEQGLQPGDKLYVMIGDTSSVPEMRNAGFVAELKANGWTDEQIDTIQFSAATGWSRSTGKQIFIDWLNGLTIEQIAEYKYIFTHDDEIAMGILEALSGTEIEESKKQAFYEAVVCLGTSSGLDEIYQVFRGEHANEAYPAIVENFDLFSVTYDPAMIKTAVQDMVDHLDGKTIDKDHTIPVEVVDSTNVANYQGF